METIKHIRISDQDETLCGEQTSVDDALPDLISSEYVLDLSVERDRNLCDKCLKEFKYDFIIDGRFESLL